LHDGVVVGEVTSGNYSPELGHGIALAFLPPEASEGDQFSIDVRGTLLDAVVVKPPFVS
jgi:aminomethyltransferase